jgi:lipopolysaccharide biosynthesis protein
LVDFPDAHIHPYPNQGMDMVPFLRLIPSLKAMGYGLVCKLHTKRGVEPLGAVWREHLLETLVGSAATVRDLIEAFNRDPLLVLAGPAALYLSAHTTMYENRPMLERLAGAMEQPPNLRDDWGFFAGSMCWMRVDALMPMASAMNKTFDFSDPQVKHSSNADGEWPHVLERAMGWTDACKKIALLSAPLDQRDQCKSRPQDLRFHTRKKISQNINKCHASKALNAINATR